tara:strand:+ start:345 stop:638 length:294 start_codon:yes stop_codon:yes gene_type:complete
MLIKYTFKIFIILIAIFFFLLFKNIAKELEANIFSFDRQISLMINQLQQKEIDLSRELHNKLISSDKKYVNSKFIIIENYFNKNMTIVKVDYDKKSN